MGTILTIFLLLLTAIGLSNYGVIIIPDPYYALVTSAAWVTGVLYGIRFFIRFIILFIIVWIITKRY